MSRLIVFLVVVLCALAVCYALFWARGSGVGAVVERGDGRQRGLDQPIGSVSGQDSIRLYERKIELRERGIRVVDRSSSEAVRDARVFGLNSTGGFEYLGATSEAGSFDARGAIAILADGYQAVSFEVPSFGESPLVVELDTCPVVRVFLQAGYSPESVLSHQFTLQLKLHPDSPLSRLCERELAPWGEGVIVQWDGLGFRDLAVPCHGTYDVQVAAFDEGSNRQLVNGEVLMLADRADYGVVFSPPLTESLVSGVLEVDFDFPEELDMEVQIIGPFAANAGGPLKSLSRIRSFEGHRTNTVAECQLEGIVPGWYECWCIAIGRGYYPMGRYEVRKDGFRIKVAREEGYVTGTVAVRNVPLDGHVELQIRRDGKVVSGHAFHDVVAGGPSLEWSYVVPRNSDDLYVVASVFQTYTQSKVVGLPTDVDGHQVLVARWGEATRLDFHLPPSMGPADLRWVEILDVEAQVSWTTEAGSSDEIGYRLVPGLYQARVCWPTVTSGFVAFSVRDDRLAVRL